MISHSYRTYGGDEVACRHCGHEPHQRPQSCPGNPHAKPRTDLCMGCYAPKPGECHKGCPTGRNGTPNYE